jgi:chitinase
MQCTHHLFVRSAVVLLALLLAAPSPAFAAAINARNDRADIIRGESDKPWLLSYYTGYQYHYFKPRDIDFTLLTHIAVGGVGVYPTGALREHWHRDGDDKKQKRDGRKMAQEVKRYADKKNVASMIWLGGPNEHDNLYLAASNEASRKRLVTELLALIDDIGYYGVDINWEPIRLQDREPLLLLVKDLREARPDLIITVPVNWVALNGTETSSTLAWYATLAKYVDKLPVMTYSMAGPWPAWDVWHSGALYGDNAVRNPSSVSSSVEAYIDAGVPSEKLLLGIGAYGTCWEYPVQNPGERVPLGYGSGKLGVLALRTIDSQYADDGRERWDSDARVPYITFRKPAGEYECGFISYENKRSAREKAEHAIENNLGGVIFWNIGTGYYPDERRSAKKHPLLREVAKELGV